MKICAIVLDYRGAKRTTDCLHSLEKQGINTALVVDNSDCQLASAELDTAMQCLQEYGPDYHLHIIRPSRNLGFARGVNLALANDAARDCDAFLLINNDATASLDMVSKLSTGLMKHDAGLVAPLIIDHAEKPQSVQWYQRYFGLITERPLPFSFSYISGCCLLFRRDILISEKLFDEDFFMYGEDTFLSWRLAMAGKTVLTIEEAVARHACNGSSQQGKIFYEYHTTRAHVLLALKTRHSPLEIPLLILTKSLYLAARAVRRCVRFKSGIPLLAFFLAWLSLDIRSP